MLSSPGVFVDCYETPKGEFRVGMAGASTLLGFAKNWLGRVTGSQGKTLKALQEAGFKGIQEEGKVLGQTGYQKVTTISLKDFSFLIFYAAALGKEEARILQLALNEIGVEDFVRDALGKRQLTMEQKKTNFYHSYASMINWQENDRSEWQLIEEQENFTGLNAYRIPEDLGE